jgi:hypothetical protein
MLNEIQNMMAAKLRKDGIAAEVTFCRDDMFSILVEDAAQFQQAKAIFDQVPTVRFDSEDCDEEIGHIAYYKI